VALTPGTRLGPYEITAQIGVGGMGEVYRATDTNLGREVAIKVLPDAFAQDAERLARFEREAKTLASLSHPNIAIIHGLEKTERVRALVMELVEGPTLADRIANGPIPLEEALPIAQQIAAALEAAHEQVIIHRDLKPANIKVRDDGTVKVLDFGLAKVFGPPQGGPYVPDVGAGFSRPTATMSPTITTPAMTQIGMILGSAAYMSPEQARGKPVDKRADIWAFGCVLFEMLTGRRAFDDEDVSMTLSRVLQREPDFDALPAAVPAYVRQTIRLCLRKPVKERLPDIATARMALEGAFATTAPSVSHDAVSSTPLWRRFLPSVAAVMLTTSIAAVTAWMLWPTPSTPVVAEFSFAIPKLQALTGTTRQVVAVSHDGRRIAYVAGSQIHVRSLGDREPRTIQGTDKANPLNPMFSSDDASIAYVDVRAGTNALMSIPIAGGPPSTLVPELSLPCGASWGSAGILIATAIRGQRGIWRVSPGAGAPELIVPVGAGEAVCGPQMLPGGAAVLSTFTKTNATSWDEASIVVHSLKDRSRRLLVENGSDGRYLPSGHLLYAVAGTMYALRFDLARLAVEGSAVPIIEGVRRSFPGQPTSASHLDVSQTGTLAYIAGPAKTSSAMYRLVIDDGHGDVVPLKVDPAAYVHPRVSPDGRLLAVGKNEGDDTDVWTYELSEKSGLRRVTFGGNNRFPIWSHDGRHITFQSGRERDQALWWQPADGGVAERLTKPVDGEEHVPEAWSSDGKHLLFSVTKGRTWPPRSVGLSYSLRVLTLADRTITPFGSMTSREPFRAVFSPNGRWVAYMLVVDSPDSPNRGVFVEPFPPTGQRHQAPRTKGRDYHPVWSRDGTRLFYVADGPEPLASVPITNGSGVVFGVPEELSVIPRLQSWQPRGYDVLPDGRFVSVSLDEGAPEIHVVLNWTEELKRLVPGK
jgi:serine/threonine-protein kinase